MQLPIRKLLRCRQSCYPCSNQRSEETSDWTVKPEIMIPLVCEVKELKYVKKVVVDTADAEIAAGS